MENPIKMDDLGGKPPIFGNIHIYIYAVVKYNPNLLQNVVVVTFRAHEKIWWRHHLHVKVDLFLCSTW